MLTVKLVRSRCEKQGKGVSWYRYGFARGVGLPERSSSVTVNELCIAIASSTSKLVQGEEKVDRANQTEFSELRTFSPGTARGWERSMEACN